MKIGILTFHCAHNYGAVLQCFALQETLKAMGHDVEVIDYRPAYLLDCYKIFDYRRILSKNPFMLIKNVINEILLLNERLKLYSSFQNFITKKLCLSIPVEESNIPSEYDVYVIGSDQIWNPNITNGFDDIYFGQFGFSKGERKYISYAASMEINNLKSEYKAYLKTKLLNFNALSVRESQLIEILQPLTSTKINLVIDPTFLIKENKWMELVVKPSIKEKYVLIYFTRTDENVVVLAKKIADKLKAKVIKISATLKYRFNKFEGSSPEMFISLIKNAECIITTSFHGTAFSLIFNKPFYYIKLHDDKNSRVLSLLSLLSLEDRAIEPNENVNFKNIDYDKINVILGGMRKESLKFLTDAINAD